MTESPDSAARWRLQQALDHPAWGWAAVALGTLLRLRRFLQDRGLMHDDAQLASNLFSKSFGELFRPLEIGNQAAPVGFLVLQKCSTVLFGHGELAIRLVPFLAAVTVLFLFFATIRRSAGNRTAFQATALLALAEPLVRYCAEGKQYSTDVLCTTVALALALRADRLRTIAVLGVVGAVLIWFSHPLLFVLGGIGFTLFITHLHNRKYALAWADAAIGALWLASFAGNYLLISRYYVSNDYLRTYWQQLAAFAPVPDSLRNLAWYPQAFVNLFDYPLGILPEGSSQNAAHVISAVAVAVFVFGCFVMGRRYPRMLGFVAIAILLAIAASALQRYPLAERLTLFCAPLIVLPLALALGIGWWWRKAGRVIVWLLACAILFVYPVYIQTKYALHPEVRYDAKPAINYVKAHWRAGDSLYLHWGSDVLGMYYLKANPPLAIPPGDLIEGVFQPTPVGRLRQYSIEEQRLRARRRVWVIFSMAPQDRPIVEQIFKRHGVLVDHEQFSGSTADLYDLQ